MPSESGGFAYCPARTIGGDTVRDNSIAMLMVVAKVLNRLPQPVVYTGGATIPPYLDALSARDMRPIDDVDCVVEVTSQREYYQLSATLRELGLSDQISLDY
jgi:hypothetical protein